MPTCHVALPPLSADETTASLRTVRIAITTKGGPWPGTGPAPLASTAVASSWSDAALARRTRGQGCRRYWQGSGRMGHSTMDLSDLVDVSANQAPERDR
jgi:hypothetical protein